MVQSQQHGFLWEDQIKKNVFEVNETLNNTNKYDVDAKNNKYNNNENISIKTTGSCNICCSDILRFYDYDFHNKNTIIVIRYKQIDNNKNMLSIYEINYNKEMHNYLFGNVPKAVLEEYVNYIKNIKKGKVDDDIKKFYKERKEQIQRDYNMNIQINPKVDSKTQRRVQCSITDAFNRLDKFIEYKNDFGLLREIQLEQIIPSKPRTRNAC